MPDIDTRAILKTRQLAQAVKDCIDAGDLRLAEARLEEGFEALGSSESRRGRELALTLQLEQATIAQYTGDFDLAAELAAAAVTYADDVFGPRGIQIGRARLRHNFAIEAKRDFGVALQKNLELEDELGCVPGSGALRLNCLTRAIACAVKNADRGALRQIGFRSEPIRSSFDSDTRDPIAHHGVLRWHYFWCAIASLRQGRRDDAERLLDYAGDLEPATWRWENAASFARGHGLTLAKRTAMRGRQILRQARLDAESRGYHGLIRSIDAGFSSPGLEATD